jgi:hypothetical protein
MMRPALSVLAPVAAASAAARGGCLYAGRPQDGIGVIARLTAGLVPDEHKALVDVGDDRVHVLLDAEFLQCLCGFPGQLRPEHRERGAAPVEQEDPRVLRRDGPELSAKRLGRHLPELARQFHARRAAPDENERQPGTALLGGRRRRCHLKCAVDPAADCQRVGDRLHPRRPPGELVMAEIRLPYAGGNDEVVIGVVEAVPADSLGDDAAASGVEIDDLGHDAVDVLVLPEQIAQRGRDLALGQDSRSALIQQRLEDMVLGAIDDGHRDIAAPQGPGREQAGKAAAHDHHPALTRFVCHCVLRFVT